MVELSAHPVTPKNHPSKPNDADTSCGAPFDKARFENILDNIPSGVVVIEKPNGKITYANKRAVELHGRNPCGIEITKPIGHLKIYSMGGSVCSVDELFTYKALFNGEIIKDQTEIFERIDGARFIVNVSAKPILDKNGNVAAVIAIFDDVTERLLTDEELRESEERLKMAQKIAHIGSWEYCAGEDRAIWSEELFRIFGLPFQTFGPTVNEYVVLIHPDDREAINKVMENLLFATTPFPKASFDYRVIRPDGSIRHIHSERMVRELGDDKKPRRIAGIEQDITERKEIEKKLEEYTKNLEQLVEERTRQLQNAERMAAIGQTAGMIGHDIRNPLQTISGELYLMRQEVEASSDNEGKRCLQESLNTIEQQVEYINKIVLDLQDYARPLKPELAEVWLHTVIPELLSTIDVPENVDAHLTCARALPKIALDVTLLKRILVNLVSNSIQAMPNGGTLSVRCIHDDGKVAIIVSDTGSGIPDEIKTKIFQPLMTTKAKGQGFGLAVVKRLVEAQGGTISFESSLCEGTKFKIVFPAQIKGN